MAGGPKGGDDEEDYVKLMNWKILICEISMNLTMDDKTRSYHNSLSTPTMGLLLSRSSLVSSLVFSTYSSGIYKWLRLQQILIQFFPILCH